MSAQHSPGPWKWDDDSNLHDGQARPDSVIFCTVEYDGGDRYAELHCEKPDRDLIAASPAMYRALLMAREELCFGGDYEAAKRIIDAALKQARGEQ